MPFPLFDEFDRKITSFLASWGIPALRISLGVIFFWFGFLKFFPGVSSAEKLAIDTIGILTFGLVPRSVSLFTLALVESIIGLGLIFRSYLRFILFLLACQMAGTFLPFLFFPHEMFISFPFVPTLEGQYIIKNLVIISAAMVIGATVRGGGLTVSPRKVDDPQAK